MSMPCSAASLRTAGVARTSGRGGAAFPFPEDASVPPPWTGAVRGGVCCAGGAAGASAAPRDAVALPSPPAAAPAGASTLDSSWAGFAPAFASAGWAAVPFAGSAAAFASAGCAAAPFAAAGAAPVSSTARTVPTETVWPSWTLISDSVPSTSEGISVFTLSVCTSTSRSYFFTCSPGCFSHLPIVPSVTDSPSLGIFSSNAISVPRQFPHLRRDPLRVRHEPVLLGAVHRRRGDLRSTVPHHGRIQTVEGLLRDERCDLCPRTEHPVVLVHDEALPGLAGLAEDGLGVERPQAADVDDVDRDPLAGEGLRRRETAMQHEPVGVHREVCPFPFDVRGTERDREVPVGHLALHRAVGGFVLEKDDGVLIAQRRPQHPGDVARRARHDDLQAGHVRVERLDRLRVIEPAVDTRAPRHADDQGNAELAVRAVADARGLVDDLLEGRRAEVRELHLGDGTQPADRRADRNADDRGFSERRVDDAAGPELVDEPLAHAEHAAARADVFAQQDVPLVLPELLEERVMDRLDVRLLHLGRTQAGPRARVALAHELVHRLDDVLAVRLGEVVGVLADARAVRLGRERARQDVDVLVRALALQDLLQAVRGSATRHILVDDDERVRALHGLHDR